MSAAFDAAGLDELPPAEAMTRLLDVGWRVAARYQFLWHQPQVSADQDRDRHAPLLERMLELIKRGQDSGDIDRTLSPGWLLAADLALGRAADDEVRAGRMSIEEAQDAVHHSVLRLLGME